MTAVTAARPFLLGSYTLPLDRYAYAAHQGVERQVNALRKRLTSLDAAHHDALEGHVAGAVAECALADWLGVPWEPAVGITHASQVDGDVLNIEIRSTAQRNPHLMLHDYSFDGRPYVLALSNQAPTITFAGWIWGREGKRASYWNDRMPRPCYFISRHELRPMCELLWLLGFLEN